MAIRLATRFVLRPARRGSALDVVRALCTAITISPNTTHAHTSRARGDSSKSPALLQRPSAICTPTTHRNDWGRAAGPACMTTNHPWSAGGVASTSHTQATGQASGPWSLAQHAGYIQTPQRRCNPLYGVDLPWEGFY